MKILLGTDISKKLHLNSVKGLDMRKRIHAVTHRCKIHQPNTFNGLCIAAWYQALLLKKQWWILWVVLKRLDVAMNARVSIIWNRVIQMRFVTHPWRKRASFIVTLLGLVICIYEVENLKIDIDRKSFWFSSFSLRWPNPILPY